MKRCSHPKQKLQRIRVKCKTNFDQTVNIWWYAIWTLTLPLFKLYHLMWVKSLIYSHPSFSMIVWQVYNYLKFHLWFCPRKDLFIVLMLEILLTYSCWLQFRSSNCQTVDLCDGSFILIVSDNMTWIPKFTIVCQCMVLRICLMQMIWSKHMGTHFIFLDAYKIHFYIFCWLSKLLAMSVAQEPDC